MPDTTPSFPATSWADFLESTPPGSPAQVSDLGFSNGRFWRVSSPDLQLHCGSSGCGGPRFFAATFGDLVLEPGEKYFFAGFQCRNCRDTRKTYAVKAVFITNPSNDFIAVKLGELPSFGPPTPSRVISLIGPDRDLFLRGRRAENLGLGLGAFAYYRRVVENQKGRLIREIREVAAKLGATPEILASLDQAAKEQQFKKALELTKGAIPDLLLIDGHNPLGLLHSALSEGLHDGTDESCLGLATSIRVVLTELAERMSVALKDTAELKAAVGRLFSSRPPSAPPNGGTAV